MYFIYVPFLIGFTVGIIKYWIMPLVNTVKDVRTETSVYYDYEDETPDTNEIERSERFERYSQQVDGYTQLIKLLDTAYKEETDTKRKAALLSKQLTIIDKLDRTIAKLEKLDE